MPDQHDPRDSNSDGARKVTDKLIVAKKGGVGRITFDNQERRNALTYEMWAGLPVVLKDFADDAAVRVIVLSGAGGKAFSAGADISEFEKQRGSADAVEVYNAAVADATNALVATRKPLIAQIDGYCIGGGLGVAMCCDLRIAALDSRFAIPAAKLGLGYKLNNLKHLIDVVGASSAMEILFTARQFNAEEALAMGLVNRVLPPGEVAEYVNGYAAAIAENAPLTVLAAKTVVREAVKDPDKRDLALCQKVVDDCFASADYQEGRKAFMEKRKPEFKGR